MTGMINIAGGLKKMGASIAATAGDMALAAQREALQRESLLLADQLAGNRESRGRAEQAGYRRQEQDRGAQIDAEKDKRQAGIDAEKDARGHTNRIGEIQESGAQARKTDAAQHAQSASDVVHYQATDDGEIIGFTRSGKQVNTGVKGKKASTSAADRDIMDRLEKQHTSKGPSDPNDPTSPEVTKLNIEGIAGQLRDMGRPDLAKNYDPSGKFRQKYGFGKKADKPGGKPDATKPAGAGTRADPFKAASQADVDWFKNSAPAGAVISVEGALYTK